MCKKSGNTLIQGVVESFRNTQLLGSIMDRVFATNSGVHQVPIHLSQCVLASLIVTQYTDPATHYILCPSPVALESAKYL